VLCFSHQFKVANIIIPRVAINVVNNLMRKQKAMEVFFHNKAVLHYIALRISIWVVGCENGPISSITSVCNPNLKSWVVVSSYMFRLPSPLTFWGTKLLRPFTRANRWLTAIKAMIYFTLTKSCQFFAFIRTIFLRWFRPAPIKRMIFFATIFTYPENLHSHTNIISQLLIDNKYCEIAVNRYRQMAHGFDNQQ